MNLGLEIDTYYYQWVFPFDTVVAPVAQRYLVNL